MQAMALDTKRQPFIEHIQELRQRLFWSALSLIVGAALGYMLRDTLLAWLIKPLNQPLYYTSPTGGFDFLFKTCLFFGLLCATPVLIYHTIKFLEPAIPVKTRQSVVLLLTASLSLLIFGVMFAYYISLPAALHFLNAFNTGQVKSLISTNEYFSFVMIYLAGFGLIFQLPLVLLFINTITPLKPKALLNKLPWVILISFIAAAIITPTPDPINQTIMATPLIVLYVVSIGLVAMANRGLKNSEVYHPAPLKHAMDLRRRVNL